MRPISKVDWRTDEWSATLGLPEAASKEVVIGSLRAIQAQDIKVKRSRIECYVKSGVIQSETLRVDFASNGSRTSLTVRCQSPLATGNQRTRREHLARFARALASSDWLAQE